MSYERLSAEMNEWAEREGATVETIHVFPRQDLSEVLLVVIYSPKVQPKDERVSAPDLEE